MGHFYTNLTLTTPKTDSIAKVLKSLKRTAFIAPPVGDFSVIFDKQCEEQDYDQIDNLSLYLSQKLGCTAFAVLIHDDDILGYWLYRKGKLLDGYCSAPDYFDEEADPEADRGGDAAILCKAFDTTNTTAVQRILDSSDYTFETERHRDLAAALRLPAIAVAYGYDTVSEGELPPGLRKSDLVVV